MTAVQQPPRRHATSPHGLAEPPAPPATADLFGVPVAKAGPDEVLSAIMLWARARRPALVDFMGVHGLALSRRDPDFKRQLHQFDIIACDGQPIRWAVNRWHDAAIAERVYGPAMMTSVCRAASEQGVGVYFYGGKPETLDLLTARLAEQFPQLPIAGAESPPFRPLTDEERRETAQRINDSGAGVVFIGLGCPKQEIFAAEMKGAIRAVQLCVGAAFDFHAGTMPMAPRWMQNAGLEWFFRLCCEPRRLWKRYLVSNATFIGLCIKQMFVEV